MTDYFEEKIIKNVLHYRTNKYRAFMPYTAEQLTCKLQLASAAVQQFFQSEDETIDEGGDCCGA